jgi:predicted transcriptional regulator
MKSKTSLTLSEDLVASIDKLAGPKMSRSAYIEQILREFVDRRAQARRGAREVAAINRHAAQLNSEMSDALTFQVNSADELGAASSTGCVDLRVTQNRLVSSLSSAANHLSIQATPLSSALQYSRSGTDSPPRFR